MLRYFVAGNLWMLVALIMYVGRTAERTGPPRYCLFGVGQWFQTHEYWAIVALPIAVSLLYFIMYSYSANKSKS